VSGFRVVLFDMNGVVIDTRQSVTDFCQASCRPYPDLGRPTFPFA
jgi:beta-phosphoglucomutase-like phosphatase (HAD superfamily)